MAGLPPLKAVPPSEIASALNGYIDATATPVSLFGQVSPSEIASAVNRLGNASEGIAPFRFIPPNELVSAINTLLKGATPVTPPIPPAGNQALVAIGVL